SIILNTRFTLAVVHFCDPESTALPEKRHRVLPTPAFGRSITMFDKIGQARLGELHFKHDEASQLNAIIAIHNTRLGPALGGCRCIEYLSDDAAIDDVIRLAQGMSYKAALANVPQGGGKAVIVKPKANFDRTALFRAFGLFVHSLGGRYITAVDSGSTLDDMDQISAVTPFVSGSNLDGLDPSPMTAL